MYSPIGIFAQISLCTETFLYISGEWKSLGRQKILIFLYNNEFVGIFYVLRLFKWKYIPTTDHLHHGTQ